MLHNVHHGVASILAVNLAVPFFGIFALKLGASNYQVALLSSAPAVVSLLAMIPGAVYVDRFPQKKRITTLFFLAHRVFFLVLACIPFMTADRRAAALVVAVALMNLPGAIGNVAWQSFISRVIPPAHRAKAFAHRNRLMNIVGTGAVVIAGRALDIMSYPIGYQVTFFLAFVAALVELRIFQRIEEPESPPFPVTAGAMTAVRANGSEHGLHRRLIRLQGSFREAVRDILAHPRFVRYTLASMVFYFMWQIAWPLFTLYQVKVLGANNLWISLLTLANTGGSVFGYGFWASFAERHGHLKTLCVSTAGIFVVPVLYAFSHDLTAIAALNLAVGAVFSGVNLSLFNVLLEKTPDEHTTTYMAYYNTAITLTAVFAPMIGVALLNLLGFFWAFLICGLGRLIGSLSFYLVLRSERRAAGRISCEEAGTGLPA